MLQELETCVSRAESFAFETTLAGLGYVRHIKKWRALGYRTTLFFLALPDADAAIARVAERVRQGGHDIPEVTIRRRFKAGWRNFQAVYRDAVDDWVLYDNAGVAPILLEWGNRG